jgi:hypothetical protein
MELFTMTARLMSIPVVAVITLAILAGRIARDPLARLGLKTILGIGRRPR